MNTIQMALIGIRIVAVYLIAQGISNTSEVLIFLSTYDPEGKVTAVVYTSVVAAIFSPLIIGVFLWFIAPKISKNIIREHSTTTPNETLNTNQFQSIALILIGVYLVAINLPHSISTIYQLFTLQVVINGELTFNDSVISNAIASNLKVIFGVILMLGSEVILKVISNIRGYGLTDKEGSNK